MQSVDPAPSSKDTDQLVQKSARSTELEQVVEKVSRRTVELAARKLLEQLLPRIEQLESDLARLKESKEQSFLPADEQATNPPMTIPRDSERPAEERAWDRLRETIDEPVEGPQNSWFRRIQQYADSPMTRPVLQLIALATAAFGTVMMGALIRSLIGL